MKWNRRNHSNLGKCFFSTEVIVRNIFFWGGDKRLWKPLRCQSFHTSLTTFMFSFKHYILISCYEKWSAFLHFFPLFPSPHFPVVADEVLLLSQSLVSNSVKFLNISVLYCDNYFPNLLLPEVVWGWRKFWCSSRANLAGLVQLTWKGYFC